MNEKRLVELFSHMRNSLDYSGKFKELSNLVAEQIEKSYFFNKSNTICIYNHHNSIVLNNILYNSSNYLNNCFVFPKLSDDNSVKLYHISSPNSLIINNFGAVGVAADFFTIDIAEIDVILVSGMAFDYDLNVLNVGNNNALYKSLLNNCTSTKIGVCANCQVYKGRLPKSEYNVDGLLTEEGCCFPIDIQEKQNVSRKYNRK